MTGDEKLEFVRDQMQIMWREQKEMDIHCPYCLNVVEHGDSACCETLMKAVNAIIEAQTLIDRIELANRILEQSARH